MTALSLSQGNRIIALVLAAILIVGAMEGTPI